MLFNLIEDISIRSPKRKLRIILRHTEGHLISFIKSPNQDDKFGVEVERQGHGTGGIKGACAPLLFWEGGNVASWHGS